MLKVTQQTTKTVIIYSLLIVSSLSPGCLSQTIQKGAVTYPNTNFQGNVAKGYSNTQGIGTLGSYSSAPVDGQYWTGYNTQLPQFQQVAGNQGAYPQYGGYNQYSAYPQYGGHGYPQQGYMQQPGYGSYQGFNSYAGQYPGFHAGYWAGGAAHGLQLPVPFYPQQYPVYQAPVYMPGQHMPYHPAAYNRKMNRYGKPYGKGFLGGTGSGIAKGLLGALLVGTIAGKVARGK